MKYLPLLWSGVWRKPVRTVLTFLSIAAAFLLFGLLQGVNAAFSEAGTRGNVDRLLVLNRVSFSEQLPLAYLPHIRAIPGVRNVSFATWFGGYYQRPSNQLTSWVVDPDQFFAVYPEYRPTAAVLAAFERTPDAVLAASATVKRFGWKVGGRLPLHSISWVKKDGNSDWIFQLVGTYDSNQSSSAVVINNRYFDEARTFNQGNVGWYIVQVTNPAQSAAVGEAIDRHFANSPDETKTVTEKEFAQSIMRQLGDINFIVTAIIGAVFFTMLFLIWNTISQSVRERIPEFAVLKTLGFPDSGIFNLVVFETLVLCLAAAISGLALAAAIYPVLAAIVGAVRLPATVVAEGIAVAIALAVISSIFPAWQMRRLRIVDALARRQ